MDILDNILKNTNDLMRKYSDFFSSYISGIRGNKFSLNLLNNIKIKCYNTVMSLCEVSNISLINHSTISIKIFDITLLSLINKSIISTLDVNPYIVNNTIFIKLPPLTEESRLNLIKCIRVESEKNKVSIRNIRRDINHQIKELFHNKYISEDNYRISIKEIQNITNTYIGFIDNLLLMKENELKKLSV